MSADRYDMIDMTFYYLEILDKITDSQDAVRMSLIQTLECGGGTEKAGGRVRF